MSENHRLHFKSRSALQAAYMKLIEEPWVDDCAINLQERCIDVRVDPSVETRNKTADRWFERFTSQSHK